MSNGSVIKFPARRFTAYVYFFAFLSSYEVNFIKLNPRGVFETQMKSKFHCIYHGNGFEEDMRSFPPSPHLQARGIITPYIVMVLSLGLTGLEQGSDCYRIIEGTYGQAALMVRNSNDESIYIS